MQKSYYRFEHEKTFGVLVSPHAPIYYLPYSDDIIITPQLTTVGVWSLRQQRPLLELHYEQFYDEYTRNQMKANYSHKEHNITSMAVWYGSTTTTNISSSGDGAEIIPQNDADDVQQFSGSHSNAATTSTSKNNDIVRVAVGYSNGRIVIYRNDGLGTKERKSPKNARYASLDRWHMDLCSVGHASAVSVLQFSDDGSVLASGGDDTDIIVWDAVACEGLYRLRGHKGKITGLVFLLESSLLLSGSKDMLIKVWELSTQHCIQTVIGTRNEIWSMAKNPAETRLVVGSTDQELLMWNLESLTLEEDTPLYERDIQFIGSVQRKTEGRVHRLAFDATGYVLAVHGDHQILETFLLRSKREQAPLLLEQQKLVESVEKQIEEKRNEQERELNTLMDFDEEAAARREQLEMEYEKEIEALEQKRTINFARIEFRSLCEIQCSSRIRSFDFHPIRIYQPDIASTTSDHDIRIVIGTLRNTVEEYSILYNASRQKNKIAEDQIQLLRSITHHGHGMPVRSIAYGSDNVLVASVAAKEVKIWNVQSKIVVRTLELSGHGMSVTFLPGAKHILVGLKNGFLELFDIASGEKLETFNSSVAHSQTVWGISVKPDKRGCITVSSDKQVKFWDFELKPATSGAHKQLTLALDHTLQMNEDVIAVKCSPKSTFLTLALLDSTVKVFYLDSLKFFLSLYGHKLPVNAMDISSDETLIVTASQDKNIKIWGLDFGDCHKSIFAHQESITSVRFQPNTHYFFTAARDGGIKYWDADRFQLIQEIRPQMMHSPLSCLEISSDSDRIVVSGHERSMITFQQSDDLVFPEEEQERIEEEKMEKDIVQSQQFKDLEENHAGRRTIETIKSGEKLIEVVELAMEEQSKCEIENISPREVSKNPLLMGMSVNQFIWNQLSRISRSDMDHVLVILSYQHAIFLIYKLHEMMVSDELKLNIERVVRIILQLVHIHHNAMLLDQSLFDTMQQLSLRIKSQLYQEKNAIGFNIAALNFVKRRLENEKELLSVDEAIAQKKKQDLKVSQWKQEQKKRRELQEQQRQKRFKSMFADSDSSDGEE